MTISVVVATYNHARFVMDALSSVETQTRQPDEVVIVDDGSTDETPDLIKSWTRTAKTPAELILRSHNVGVCRSLNEALASVRGTHLAFLSGDDLWHPNKLSVQSAVLATAVSTSRRVVAVYGDADLIDESGNRLPGRFIESERPGLLPPSGNIFSTLLDGNFIPAPSALIVTAALREVGGFDDSLPIEDWDAWLKLADIGDISFCDEIVGCYRVVSDSYVRSLNEATKLTAALAIYRKWARTGSGVQHARSRLATDSKWAFGNGLIDGTTHAMDRLQASPSLYSVFGYASARLGRSPYPLPRLARAVARLARRVR